MQQGSSPTATLTDEQILDMEPEAVAQQTRTNDRSGAESGGTAELPPSAGDNGAAASATVGDAGRATDKIETSSADKGSAASDPPWLVALDAQPEAAAEARRWRDAAKDVSALDAAYFSAEPGARSGLAARLYQSDAAAFRAMLAEGARTLAARDPQGLAELARLSPRPRA